MKADPWVVQKTWDPRVQPEDIRLTSLDMHTHKGLNTIEEFANAYKLHGKTFKHSLHWQVYNVTR